VVSGDTVTNANRITPCHAAAVTGISPDHCVYVGDAENDIVRSFRRHADGGRGFGYLADTITHRRGMPTASSSARGHMISRRHLDAMAATRSNSLPSRSCLLR
jgi:hypothetical protein